MGRLAFCSGVWGPGQGIAATDDARFALGCFVGCDCRPRIGSSAALAWVEVLGDEAG